MVLGAVPVCDLTNPETLFPTFGSRGRRDAHIKLSRATMRSLALIALIALCVSVGARADTDEPFNGAVHSDPGTDTAVDDGMTEEAHAVAWIDVEMNGDIFVTRKSWQPPQYHLEDDTYVRMRGWLSTIRAAAAGEAVFRLPEDARPGRAEPWKVSMKGTDREILLGKFILILVTRTGN